MVAERQRREDGAPEQQRPRDRTGRPLAFDTTVTLLAETHEPGDVEQALALGRTLWNETRFFEAHECLEAVWHAAPRNDRALWQGVIQVAVAEVHRQRGNPQGAVTLYQRALTQLEGYPAVWRGVDVATLTRYANRSRHSLLSHGEGLTPPVFPDAEGGAWFANYDDQDAPSPNPTPLVDTPRWLREGQRRSPQRRATR